MKIAIDKLPLGAIPIYDLSGIRDIDIKQFDNRTATTWISVDHNQYRFMASHETEIVGLTEESIKLKIFHIFAQLYPPMPFGAIIIRHLSRVAQSSSQVAQQWVFTGYLLAFDQEILETTLASQDFFPEYIDIQDEEEMLRILSVLSVMGS